MNEADIKQAIQHETQQAQQPLLERIDELEQDMERANDYIWKANTLLHVLMNAFPKEHAEKAACDLRDMLNELPDAQLKAAPAQDVLARQRSLAQAASPRES